MNFGFFNHQSLKTRITLVTLLVLLLSIGVLGTYAGSVMRQDLGRHLGEQQFATVSLLAAQIDQELTERRDALEMLAAEISPAVLASTSELQHQLENRPVLLHMFNAGIFVTRADGKAIAGLPYVESRLGINVMDRDYMVAALRDGKSSVGVPVLGKGSGKPGFTIAAPIRDSQSNVIGVVAGIVQLGLPNFIDKITASTYGKTGGYFVASGPHRLNIVATDKSRTMTALPGPGISPELDRFVAGFEGTQVYVNPLGVEVMVSAKGIAAAGWTLVANLPAAEAFAPIHDQRQRMALASLVVLLLAGGVMWRFTALIVKRQLAPMLDTTKTLHSLVQLGQTPQALPIVSQDEVGELIGGFNRLLQLFGQRETAIRESNAYNQVLFASSPTALFVLSPETGQILDCNQAAVDIYRMPSREAVLRCTPLDVSAALQYDGRRSEDCVGERIEEALRMGVCVFEWRQQRPNGEVWDAQVHLRTFDHGGRTLLQYSLQDITQNKRDMQRLAQSEASLTKELGNVLLALDQHAIVAITDVQGRITSVNEKFCQISGYAREELLGQDHKMINSGTHPKEFFVAMYRTISSGKTWHGEVCNRAKDGHLYWVQTTITPAVGADGKPDMYVAIRADITQRKSFELELQDHRTHLEGLVQQKTAELQLANTIANAANRSKSEFLANMSHEIRTPMNGVVGMVDILQQTEMTATQHRMLGTIHQSSMALLHILNDILDFSKIEAGKLEIESIPTYLRETVEGAAQLMLSLSSTRSVELSVFVSPALPKWILCDPNRLRQVMLNLLGNAVKFSGSLTDRRALVILRVEPCTLAQGAPGVMLRIIDNGIGMTEAVVSKLFQPFTQADESTARQFGGTGLGLSITQRLLALMHGQITVRSALGEGSEFSVELPLIACEPGRALAAEPDLAGVHVLAVTRDPQAMLIVPAYLQDTGATVTVVPDVVAARALLLQSAKPLTSTVVLICLHITTPTSTFNLPPDAVVVRMVVRGSDNPTSDITVFARPLLHDDLTHVIAVASGRLERRSSPERVGVPSAAVAVHANHLILLAEDNETNREVMQEQLRLLGYRCELADDGAIALQMWQANPGRYALLLTDCHMPHLDGFGLTAAIRTREPIGTRLPIIAATANAMQGEAERCREHGMDDYLSKPLRMIELAPMLTKWLPLVDDNGTVGRRGS
jgi:PAS domain S-box-containing protein